MRLNLPPLLQPRPSEKQRSEHNSTTRERDARPPRGSNPPHQIRFSSTMVIDTDFYRARNSQSNGNGVIDHCIDERGGETLMFFGHVVGEENCAGGEGHVHA